VGDLPDPALVQRAEAGDPEAQNALGLFYAACIPEDGAEAAAELWFGRAAEQNFPRAKHNLGVLHVKRINPEDADDSNWDLAFDWLKAAAVDGWIPSVVALAAMYRDGGDLDQAAKLFEIAARQGDAESQGALAALYLRRENEEGYRLAHYWAELAAPENVASAQVVLGQIYHEGLGIERDPVQAIAWFLMAARNDHPAAQLLMGTAYEAGVVVQRDRLEAAFWLMRAIDQGSDVAKAYLRRYLGDLTAEETTLVRQRLDHTVFPIRSIEN
jgi:TPR repeat protein